METVGERIKRLRKNANLTQTELAEKLGLQFSAISKYENELVPLPQENLLKLSKIFSVSTDYILTGKDTITEPIEIAASMKDKADLSQMSDKDKAYILDLIERLKNK